VLENGPDRILSTAFQRYSLGSFVAASSQRTKRIRLGYGIVLMPPGYNHPGRVAERIAALDLVSDGRQSIAAKR
jgi:alkanesulfonate monooxygenase SsuD/methylene tetrahydromethanopterin reductase-like flavin-dependent oxidoreductase (luciferase family)